MLIRTVAYPRAGLVGNPSDGYFGKTISFAFTDFCAEVILYETPTGAVEVAICRNNALGLFTQPARYVFADAVGAMELPVEDLDSDSIPELIGKEKYDGNDVKTFYNPFRVYRLFPEFSFDSVLSQRYNTDHYVFEGYDYDEEMMITFE